MDKNSDLSAIKESVERWLKAFHDQRTQIFRRNKARVMEEFQDKLTYATNLLKDTTNAFGYKEHIDDTLNLIKSTATEQRKFLLSYHRDELWMEYTRQRLIQWSMKLVEKAYQDVAPTYDLDPAGIKSNISNFEHNIMSLIAPTISITVSFNVVFDDKNRLTCDALNFSIFSNEADKNSGLNSIFIGSLMPSAGSFINSEDGCFSIATEFVEPEMPDLSPEDFVKEVVELEESLKQKASEFNLVATKLNSLVKYTQIEPIRKVSENIGTIINMEVTND